ncbi:MAG: hypothetical protein Q4D14_01425 [Bacteroidales bacterium]|nr:hypothetical protein [Bacteroidales bacterium]
MGKVTETLMHAPQPPRNMGFVMPMFKSWVPRGLQPWIYVVTVFCVQFSSGVYLGALDNIRGTTSFMIEDLVMLLYAGLAGMAIYFPLLFRMKFRFTNQQLLIGAAVTIAVCNLITMHATSMFVLVPICFIAGMAKLQGTFECMSNIQLWFTPKRDFGVFFPVLHIVLLTAIEGSGFLAAFIAHHFTWQMMHVYTVGTMSFVVLTQLVLCRPFCPLPQRLSLKGIDFPTGLLISALMLVVSYMLVYGDYYMWFDAFHMRVMLGITFVLLSFVLHRVYTLKEPYVELQLFKYKNVVPIIGVVAIAELLLGCEHTLEEILYSTVIPLEELTKEKQFLWALPGIYIGVIVSLIWLAWKKWEVWHLVGIGFGCILMYALLMYFRLDVNVNIEQFRLAIMFRGCATCILAVTLMWGLETSVHDLDHFFMGLFVFNILHMYLAGAAGYGIYTTLFSHFLNDNLSRYGSQLTLTQFDPRQLSDMMSGPFINNMMSIAIKRIYGIVIWVSGFFTLLFMLLYIPYVRRNFRKIPLWPVYAIEYLSKRSGRR